MILLSINRTVNLLLQHMSLVKSLLICRDGFPLCVQDNFYLFIFHFHFKKCPCTLKQGVGGHIQIPDVTVTGRMHLCNRVMKWKETRSLEESKKAAERMVEGGRVECARMTSPVPIKLQFTFVIPCRAAEGGYFTLCSSGGRQGDS